MPSDRATKYNDERTKDTATPGLRPPLDVWGADGEPFWGRVPGNSKERRPNHPNQLPEVYLERVLLSASDPEDLVLDPFLGSGTSCTVARALGRRSIGIERSPQSAQSAFERIRLGRGSLSRWPGPGRHVTLIEEEALEAVRREHDLDLGGGLSRRNLVTAGVLVTVRSRRRWWRRGCP